jgi:hypothetical protein
MVDGGVEIMQIVKTRTELEGAVGASQIAYLGFSKKSFAGELHDGHIYLVDYAKSKYGKVVVNFWNSYELMRDIFKLTHLEPEIPYSWDYNGCYKWCEDNGVDIVFDPDFGYSAQFLKEMNIDVSGKDHKVYDDINSIWQQNNYPDYPPEVDNAYLLTGTCRAKMFVMLQTFKKKLNQTFVTTWKDGFPSFIRADWVTKYSSESFDLIDPLKDSEGMYYSSSNSSLSESQKNTIRQFESVVGYTSYDNTEALRNVLQELDTTINVVRVDTLIGGICGEKNDFINIQYKIGDEMNSYPIYKKGVR